MLEPSPQLIVILIKFDTVLFGNLEHSFQLIILSQQILKIPLHLYNVALVGLIFSGDLNLQFLSIACLNFFDLPLQSLILLSTVPEVQIQSFDGDKGLFVSVLALFDVSFELGVLLAEDRNVLLEGGNRSGDLNFVFRLDCVLELDISSVDFLKVPRNRSVSIVQLPTLFLFLFKCVSQPF